MFPTAVAWTAASDRDASESERGMKRQIRWTERLPDHSKRDVRVTVHGGAVKWQFKRSDEEAWHYDTPPSEEDWDRLEDELARRARRGHLERHRDLDCVRAERTRRS